MSRPLLLQSKLLCFSLLYLFTCIFIALYASLSTTRCLFALTPSDQILHTLFSYPATYGERKYAMPSVHSSCTSPVYFSDYGVVLKEIQDLCRNSSTTSSVLRYVSMVGESFAGNLSTQMRKSYFDHDNDDLEIPCGFMKEFPVTNPDRLAMESCRGIVVASAVFGDYDKIRQPRGMAAKTLDNVCFFMFIDNSTLLALHSHHILLENNRIGAWRIVIVSGELPYKNPAMNGVIPKYLIHRLFPNAKFSIWLDAKLQLTADPLLLIHALLASKNADMAISKHPHNIHTMEEAIATARWKKWGDVASLRMQMEVYCENGLKPWNPSKLPYTTDVPDTALIVRKHGLTANLFSCLLFNELEAFNPRDQLAFAYVRDLMTPRIKINMFDVEVFEHIAVEYRHNLKRGDQSPPKEPNSRTMTLLEPVSGSRCEDYLKHMWGESHD